MIPFRPELLTQNEGATPDGLSVIEASAGTGKTFAISHLVPRFLLEGVVARLDEIVLVTFTNDAARELSDRTRKVLELLAGDPAPHEPKDAPGVHELRTQFPSPEHRRCIQAALLDIDLLTVSTIHSFCQRIIQSEGALCGIPTPPELTPNNEPLVEEALYDLWAQNLAPDPILSAIAKFQNWSLRADQTAVRQMLSLDEFVLHPPPVPLEEIRDRLAQGPDAFTADILAELTSFLAEVPKDKWNKAAGGQTERDAAVHALSHREEFAAWVGSLEFLAGLGMSRGGMIAAKGASQKALIERASALTAVQLAREILELLRGISWSWQAQCADSIRATVAAALHKNRQVTYDDLIRIVRDALAAPSTGEELASRIRSKFRLALVDESQDTDLRQFEIFRKIFLAPAAPLARVVLVGDPKQAIYEFRGADVNTYLEARSQAGGRVYTLDATYRSPAPLVGAVNALFGRQHSFLKEGLEFSPARSALTGDIRLESGEDTDAARVEVWMVPDSESKDFSNKSLRTTRIAGVVATQIAALISSGAKLVREGSDASPVGPEDFAVLTNTHNEAEAVRQALADRGIPAIRAGAADIFCSEEAAELQLLLRALLEPRSRRLRSSALATRLLGRTSDDLRSLAEQPEAEEDLAQKFVHWHEILSRSGIAAVLAEIDASEEMTLRLARTREGERRITNLRQLTDLLQQAALDLGGGPAPLLHWFSQEIAGAGDRAGSDERQQQLESDARAVQVVTMHAAKGLEYNLVFCPFLWGMPPERLLKGVRKLAVPNQTPRLVHAGLLGTEDPDTMALTRATLEDRLRLAYVAITRAKVKVWICAGACDGNGPVSALDWLFRPADTKDFSDWIEHFEKKQRGSLHSEGLSTICEAFPEARDFLLSRPLPPANSTRVKWQVAREACVLHAAPAPPIPPPWGITSFSALTKEKDPKSDPISRLHDAPNFPLEGTSDQGPEKSLPRDVAAIFSVPGGPRLGTAIHDWIESWDFSEVDRSALSQHLGRYALPDPKGREPGWLAHAVWTALEELRGALLPGIDAPLAEVCPKPSASEWHFHLPIHEVLTSQKLADTFRRHDVDSRYLSRLDELPAASLAGYLQGFVDRIVFHGGTWGVIDWKTNFLGPGPEAYDLEALTACAYHSHYFLQAHLYLVALRRWLGPSARIAGAWLVFLRPARSGTSEGILPIQPSGALLADLDTLFFKP